MSGPNLRAYPTADGGFTAVHVDPRGCAWTVCPHRHETEAEALRCAGLELADAALGLRRTHAGATGDARAWEELPAAELRAWREKRKLSQRDAAAELGVGFRTVQRAELAPGDALPRAFKRATWGAAPGLPGPVEGEGSKGRG